MNMLTKQLRRRFDLDGLWLICWAAISSYYWLLWGLMQSPVHIRFVPAEFLLAATIGLAASSILRSIGYFDLLRIVPRKSDFLLLLFALSVGGATVALVHSMVFSHSPSALFRLTLSLPLVASLYFDAYTELTRWISRVRKRRVILHLRPDEADEFVQSLVKADLSKEVRIFYPSQVMSDFSAGKKSNMDVIIFSQAAARDMQSDWFLLRAHLAGIPIIDRRSSMASLTRRVSLKDIDVWSYISSAKPQTTWIRFGRRVQSWVEPLIALIMLVVLSPVFSLIAILIKTTSKGPVFYSQKRTGYMGKTFFLHKFRSMRSDSESSGYQWAQKSDPRITTVGRFLRKTRLDELPQFWNVACREMAFVGPRPERPEFYQDLREKIPLFFLRTDVRPGITGWAQVCAGYAASIEESKIKLEHDLYYIQHTSMRLDLVVLLMTLKVVIFGHEYIPQPAELPIETAMARAPGLTTHGRARASRFRRVL